MTRYQKHVLKFIASFMEQSGGISPSLDEIAFGIGITSKGSVVRYLDVLEADGFIRRVKRRSRSIQIIDPGEVKLNAEIFKLVQDYAKREQQPIDVIVNEALRGWLGAAA